MLKGQKAIQALPVQMALRVTEAFKDSPEQMEQQVLKEQRVHKVLKGILVNRVLMVLRVQEVLRVHKDQ